MILKAPDRYIPMAVCFYMIKVHIMKLCEYCKKPIELALLEHNNETTVCGRCRKLDVNEFYDVIKKEP